MGPLPGKEKRCALDVKVEEEVDSGSYVRQLISYASESPTQECRRISAFQKRLAKPKISGCALPASD